MEKLLLIIFFLFSSFVSINSSKISAIFTFGDSIFDAGNNRFLNNCLAQANFPPYGSTYFHYPTGRFTDGRTVVDFLSQFIGIEFQLSYLEAQMAVVNGSLKGYPSNGINFASAGSGVFPDTNKFLGMIPIQDQLQQFKTLVEQNQIDKELVQNSIYFFEAGSNDIFNYFNPFVPRTLDQDAYVEAMLIQVARVIDQLYNLGARRIAVFSLGPVGCVPARTFLPNAPVDKCFEKMNRMAKKYNKGLESLVEEMPGRYPDAIGLYGGVYDLVQQIRASPTQYGFSNTSHACCGGGALGGKLQCGREGYELCPNPNEFLFWDFFHPSEHTYELISKAIWEGSQTRIGPVNLKTLATITFSHQ